MKLRFGEIEEVLQAVHAVPETGQLQFRSKLRNLFRVGLDLPGGRVGRRANYDTADLFKMAFAAELLQFGIPPEKTARSVSDCWRQFVTETIVAWRASKSENPRWGYFVATPQSLIKDSIEFTPMMKEALVATFEIYTLSLDTRRLLVLHPGALLRDIIVAGEVVGIDVAALKASLDASEAAYFDQRGLFDGNR